MGPSDLTMANLSAEIEKKIKHSAREKLYTFDEAIKEARMGKCQAILTILTGLAVMGTVVENISISFVLPYVRCELDLTPAEQGLLASVSYLGIVFTSQLWGFLADTWGRQKVLRLAAVGGFLFSFASAFATRAYVMILLRLAAGTFLAGTQAGAYSYISEFHSQKKATVAAALISVFINAEWIHMAIGAIFIMPMEWSVDIFGLELKSWRLFLLFNSLFNLWNAIAFCFLPESPKFLLAMNRKAEALEILRRIYAINTGKNIESYPVKDIAREPLGNSLSNTKGFGSILQMIWKQTRAIFIHQHLANTLKLCFIIFFMFLFGHGMVNWVPDFLMKLQNEIGSEKTLCEIIGNNVGDEPLAEECNINNKDIKVYLVLLAYGIIFVISSTLICFSMEAIKPKTLIFGWLTMSTIACVLLNYLNEYYAIVVSMGLCLSCCMCACIVMAVAVNLYPTAYRAMATSVILMCGRIGGVAGSVVIGAALENYCSSIFYFSGAFLMSCSLVFITIKINTNSARLSISETRRCSGII